MKDKNDVVKEFNQYVNMTASELEKWLKSSDAKAVGWSKDDGSGESVGHDSGRKIIAILKANPTKDPKKYTDDQVDHMRRVVAYCKRHIAQEKGPNKEKSTEEVKKSKSYASLKNWGHDPLKKLDSKEGAQSGQNEEDNGEEEDDKKQAGQKRKAPSKTKQSQKPATTGTRKSQRLSNQSKTTNGASKTKQEDDKADQKQEERSRSKNSSGKKPTKGPKPGDTVSWNWGSGAPKGKVLDVKGEKATVTTKRGNKVSREGDPQDPAVILDAGKSKAIKFNHELNET